MLTATIIVTAVWPTVSTAILAAKKPRNVLIFIKTPQGFVLLKKRVVLVNYLVAGAI